MLLGRWTFFLFLLSLAGCDKTPQIEAAVTMLAVAPGCDVQQGCRIEDDAITVDVRFDAVPRALQSIPLSLRVAGDESVKGVSVTFSMPGMAMGLNRYRLVGNAARGWTADITLPVCVSGRSDWVAEFELQTERRQLRFRLPFVLQKP